MSALLEINDLHADYEDITILRGIDLHCGEGEVHAIMGPNGSGKSTLAQLLAGREGYRVTRGTIRFRGQDLLAMSPDQRAAAGVFLGFQYPIEIAGVATMTFLKTALESIAKARDEAVPTTPEFIRRVREKANILQIPFDFLKRPLNTGFSGGEKKRNEILQALLLEPSLAVLDETDSGLDIDALRIVGQAINRLRAADRTLVLITHYHRLLDHIAPDRVHILAGGRIIQSGDAGLARQIEAEGYGGEIASAADIAAVPLQGAAADGRQS